MSWDVIFMRTPDGITTLGQIPQGFIPPSLGSRSEIVTHLENALPGLRFIQEEGVYEGNDHSITIDLVSIGEPDLIRSVYAHVRGGGTALKTLETMWQIMRCSAFDGSTGDRLTSSTISNASFEVWREYRNTVLGGDNHAVDNEFSHTSH